MTHLAVIIVLMVASRPPARASEKPVNRDAGVAVSPGSTPAKVTGKAEPAKARSRPPWDVACASDLAALCKTDVQGRTGRGCLVANEDRLSDSCYDAVIRPGRFAELCMPDLNRFCRDKPIEGLDSCLKGHMAELTEGCRASYEGRHRLPKPNRSPARPPDKPVDRPNPKK